MTRILHVAAFSLTVLGAINWGLKGVANLDLVDFFLHELPVLRFGVYILIGIAGFYTLFSHSKDCRTCKPVGI